MGELHEMYENEDISKDTDERWLTNEDDTGCTRSWWVSEAGVETSHHWNFSVSLQFFKTENSRKMNLGNQYCKEIYTDSKH